jgi:toxin CptA
MLRVTLKPSRSLAAVLIVAHVAAGATLWPLDVPAWGKLSLAALMAMSLAFTVRRHALLASAASVRSIEIHEEDRAAVHTRAGGWQEARVLGTTYVSPLLTVLNFRVAGRVFAQHAVIVPDNVDGDAFRRLRVLLRWAYRQKP